MKTYCIASTINVFVNAENLDEAHDIFGDIDIGEYGFASELLQFIR